MFEKCKNVVSSIGVSNRRARKVKRVRHSILELIRFIAKVTSFDVTCRIGYTLSHTEFRGKEFRDIQLLMVARTPRKPSYREG